MLLVFFVALLLLDVYRFEVWPQILDFPHQNFSLESIYSHPHGVRYLLILPALLISDFLNIQDSLVFSLYVFLIMLLAIFCLQKLLVEELPNKPLGVLFLVVFFVVIFLNMNGRMAFSLAGASIQIYVLYHWGSLRNIKKISLMILSLFLCSVSSGTFLLIFLIYSFFIFKNSVFVTGVLTRTDALFLVFMFIVVAISPIIFMFIFKNLSYFGGGLSGLYNMLGHGFGSLFIEEAGWGLIVYILVCFLSFAFFCYVSAIYKGFSFAPWFFVLTIFGGLFGYSTATIALPLYLVVMARIISRVTLRGFVLKVNSAASSSKCNAIEVCSGRRRIS
tara:strand:+ start:20021 stop:21019 length:999 start_codon:yes stop_codon:yes gene_type:complete